MSLLTKSFHTEARDKRSVFLLLEYAVWVDMWLMLCTRHTGCHLICSCTPHLWHFFLSLLCCLPKAFPATGTSRSACLLPVLPLCLPPASLQCAWACGWLPEQPHQPTGRDKSPQGPVEDNAPAKPGVQIFARHLCVTSTRSQAGYHQRMNNTDAAAVRVSQAEAGQKTPQANTSVTMYLLPDYSYAYEK